MRARAAVILIQFDKIALIERYRLGNHYLVFPGGKVEPEETPTEAAAREAEEELGLKVKIGPIVAEIWYSGAPQYYYLAQSIGGVFGQGAGAEMRSTPGSPKGSHFPMWLSLPEIMTRPVLPRRMAEYIWKSHRSGWPEIPLIIKNQLPDKAMKA